MNELSLYYTDGLFHNIVKRLPTFEGRYTILPKGNLNADNVLTGVDFSRDTRYPIVACFPPMSFFESTVVNGWETFLFRLFFLTTTHYTGDNQIKGRDANTNTSMVGIPEDWQEMKQGALDFIHMLEFNQRNYTNYFYMPDREKVQINRVSVIENDRLSGVVVRFGLNLALPCAFIEDTIDPII